MIYVTQHLQHASLRDPPKILILYSSWRIQQHSLMVDANDSLSSISRPYFKELKFTGFRQKIQLTLWSSFKFSCLLHKVFQDILLHFTFCILFFFFVYRFWQTKFEIHTSEAKISFLKALAAVILSSPKAKILIQISSISVSIFLSNFRLPQIIPKVCIYTVCFCLTFFIRIASSVNWIDLGQILQSQKMQILTPICLLFFH